MATKFLDYDGLLYFWSKIKSAFVAKESGKGLSTNDFTTAEKNKLAGIASGAEVNQNAFSNVKVGSTTISADAKTDTLTLTAGSNITLTPDSTSDSVTIAASNAVTSVAGKTGDVTLTKSDVGLGNVDNTADANKVVASAAKLTTAVNVEGIMFDGSAAVSHYASCPTAATTAAKVATITPTTTNFALVTGARVYVKFTQIINVANATLNVNNTGAKAIYYNGAALAKGLTDANGTYEFVYNGTQWELVGDLDTNTTYSTMTQDQATAGSSTTGMLIPPSVLKTTIANAIAGVTQIRFEIVDSLPATGENGVIYLVAHSHGTGDAYDEYIWTGSAYEKIGNTDIDLSGYWAKADLVVITNSEIDTIAAS